MRIGIDIKIFLHNSSGIARYLRELLEALQNSDQTNEYFLFECRPTGYTIHNKLWKKIPSSWPLPGVLWQQFVLPFILRKYSLGVFWAPEQICPVFFMNNVTIITTVHDCVTAHFPKTNQWSVTLINKLLLSRTLCISRWIVAVSEFTKKDLLQLYGSVLSPDKVMTIPNGKPSWALSADYSPQKRGDYLFFAGNAEPRKNLLNAIKALELLHEKGMEIPFFIAGPAGWKNKQIFKYIKKSSVRSAIHFLGYCDEKTLQSHYLNCKAFLYPSIYEGFGLPVLEALCLDCLVLTSKKTVMEEIAGHSALYFDPTDPASIARTIASVFTADFDRASILIHKEAVLKKYSWNSAARQLSALFDPPELSV